jgi:hypothetical protein
MRGSETVHSLRCTVATLQEALTRAHAQIREKDARASEMNIRYIAVVAERDELELQLAAAAWHMRSAGEECAIQVSAA